MTSWTGAHPEGCVAALQSTIGRRLSEILGPAGLGSEVRENTSAVNLYRHRPRLVLPTVLGVSLRCLAVNLREGKNR